VESPKREHLDAVKRVLRYVVGTMDYGLLYPRGKSGSFKLLGYSDSDMAGDIDEAEALRTCCSSWGMVLNMELTEAESSSSFFV
jgi:hypothetical protein